MRIGVGSGVSFPPFSVGGGGAYGPGSPSHHWGFNYVGDPLSQWTDDVGGNHLLTGGPDVLSAWQNGLDGLSWSSNNMILTTPIVAPAGFTIAFVGERTVANAGSGIYPLGSSTTLQGWRCDNAAATTNQTRLYVNGTYVGGTYISDTTTWIFEEPVILVLQRAANGDIRVYKNGSDVTSGTPNNTETLTVNYTGWISGAGGSQVGVMSHLMFWHTGAVDQEDIFNYLNGLWAIV